MPDEQDPFTDPDAPQMPPMPSTSERREAYYADRATRKANYYASRYGPDHRLAKGNTLGQEPPAPPEDDGQYGAGGMGPPAPPGVGNGAPSGDQELIAVIRELVAAIRGMQGV